MAEFQLTKSQQAVVLNRGGPLLVSAAAGSGKTKVLVDRLLHYICDAEKPCNIDDFLIITYTNAAASELRVKIAQALSLRMAKEPENRHLQRQMSRLYLAEISTVHAFCSNLIRTYAYTRDIPADFRMIEETESETLQGKILDVLLEEGYTEKSVSFQAMVEAFGYGRDDHRLRDAVQMAHRAMRCRADMNGWIDEMIKALDVSQYTDVSETVWGSYVLDEFRVFLEQQLCRMSAGLEEMALYPIIEKGYGQTFQDDIRQIEKLLSCRTWDEICSNGVDVLGKCGTVRKPEDVAVKNRLKNLRDNCRDSLREWQKIFYACSDALLEDLAKATPGAQALLQFTKTFDEEYGKEKKRRKLMDFSDLEHTAISILTDRYTGQPSAIAKEVSKRYVEIMVDEYQDSNQVQEVIFEAISRAGMNRFMVGDVKQSIYRFRLADPSLFLAKYASYPDYEQAEDGASRKILLSENFRSRAEVLEACNDVFRLVMRKRVGDLDYGDGEALRPGKSFPSVPYLPVELHCLTSENREGRLDKRELEAEFVASRIDALLWEKTKISDGDGLRAVTPGDIVILMRSVSNNAPSYLEALARRGIPAVCNRNGSLLDTTEVQVLSGLLQIIDNPHQDVPLMTVLASPVFGFTPEKLAQPRMSNRKDDYYDTIRSYGGEFASFVTLLDQLRHDASWMCLHELIDSIFRRTKLLHVFSAMQDGAQRERNLMAFRNFAVSFEATGSRALPQFLWYIQDLQKTGGQLPIPSFENRNAVTIMSVHKSKGLEFPVVFLADLSRQFNMQDTRDAILVDDQLGVGCNRVDNQRFVRYPTLAKKSIERKKRRETISEELRVLYVAMTRAKDMLIMTYYSKWLKNELETSNEQLTIPLRDDLCENVSNPGKWLLMAALCRTEAGELHQITGGNEVSSVRQMPWKVCVHDLSAAWVYENEEETVEQVIGSGIQPEEIRMLQYEYPKQTASGVPAKVTATQLKGRKQDSEAADGASDLAQHASFQFRSPCFLKNGLTAAEKGTAIHLFMQFAKYEMCVSEAKLEEELHRLRLHGFMTPEQIEAVDVQKILKLFSSEWGDWLLNHPDIQREFKFSILIDAGIIDAAAKGEQVMLQGVVDCFVVEPDGITILDFKTDHVGSNLQERAAYYRPQLMAYADALSKIYDCPVKRKVLYFFDGDQAVCL